MTNDAASVEKFIAHYHSRGMSPETIRGYRSDLMQVVGGASFDDAAFIRQASDYLTARRNTVAPRSTRRMLAACRSYGKWAGMGDILSDYRAPTPARSEPHPLPEGIPGVIKMLETATLRRHRAVIALQGLCALRVDEAVQVVPADVDLAAKRVLVRGKGSKQRRVPISALAMQYLKPAVETATELKVTLAGGIGSRQARKMIARVGQKALGHHVASHDLRATALTAFFNRSKNLRVVQELAGHADSKTTEIYTQVAEKDMADAAELEVDDGEA